jgi:hypothetical protein
MTRKLLPYEYDLIDALGVTKEEYLDFVAQQHIYEDPKQALRWMYAMIWNCCISSDHRRHPLPGGIYPADAKAENG